MKNLIHTSLAILMSISLFGCGNSSTSTANSLSPLDIFSSETPQLNGILSNTNPNPYTGSTLQSGFTSSNPYWVFNANSFGTAGYYIAPANGYVSRIDIAQLNGVSVTYVTLIHSGSIATRVYGMQVVNVRQGDTVLQGSIIGQYLNSGQVAFQVLYNNTAVCPLSYMTNAFRTSLAAGGYYAQLCF
jgi:murein DD-endopeptidase MepM/ murein hydrolase activator NlpD